MSATSFVELPKLPQEEISGLDTNMAPHVLSEERPVITSQYKYLSIVIFVTIYIWDLLKYSKPSLFVGLHTLYSLQMVYTAMHEVKTLWKKLGLQVTQHTKPDT
jgi:hypothetical protein